ncbi:MAG: FkbM family methyltransferase [Candidatus Saccharibacteria bacterium]|nr:FkbM family methyltransferase [Candidatus Saccharibacteria bacterium]
MLERTTTEIPGLGWTEKLHPKFAEKSPGQAMHGAARRIVSIGDPRRRALFQLEKDEAELRGYFAKVLEEVAEGGDTMMQIGAHDGSFDDPFSALVPSFKRAVLVEPQAEQFKKLQERYKDVSSVILRREAVAATSGSIVLHRAAIDSAAEFGSAIAATDPEQVQSEIKRCLGYRAVRKVVLEKEEVPATTMAALLADTMPDGASLTMLASDTEGSDALVVRGAVGEHGLRPPVIQYEHLHVDQTTSRELTGELSAIGYQLTKTHKDTLAVLG